eukprot:7561469-Pyramimonas_sp.AAC.1
MPGRPHGPRMFPRRPQTGTNLISGRPQEDPVAPAGSRRNVEIAWGRIQDGPRSSAVAPERPRGGRSTPR